MYSVSNDYLTAITSNARAHKISGTVRGTSFDDGDIIRNSFVYKNQFCPATEIELGGVYVGELDLTFTEAFANTMNIRGSWRGLSITISFGVELEDSTFEYVPIGVFTIEQAVWSDAGLKVVAYDNMSKFDATAQFTTTAGSLFDLLSLICTSCSATLGMTQAECEALPNGTETLTLVGGSSIMTYRDMLSQLAAAVGCFATIDRSGYLVFRPMPDTSVITDTIPAKLRYSTSFSDYTSFYSDLEVQNMVDDTVSLYFNTRSGGLTMKIGANPFLQYGEDADLDRQRQAVIDSLEPFSATPFSVSILPNPAYDLGDVIQFTGGIGANSIGVIMSYTIKMDCTVIEGYGENPAASTVMSKEEKQIASNAKNSKSQGITYYPFINADAITLSHTEKKIYEIYFATADQTTVTLWHELKILSALDGSTQKVKLHYYYDGGLIEYEPINTYGENGYHLFKGDYWLVNVAPGVVHRFKVAASIDSGSATIAAGDVHALLMGQKMDASTGGEDGYLSLTDEYTPLVSGPIFNSDLTESVTLTTAQSTETFYLSTVSGDGIATTGGDNIVISGGNE